MDRLLVSTLVRAVAAIAAVGVLYSVASSSMTAFDFRQPLAAIWVAVAVFQLAIAGGAPLGEWTQGGQSKGVLPRNQRIAAVASAAVLLVFAWAAVSSDWGASRVILQIAAAYSALGVVLNAISRSGKEALLWTPVTLLGFYFCVEILTAPVLVTQ